MGNKPGELGFDVIDVDGAVEVENDESKTSRVCSVESGWRVTKVNEQRITTAKDFYIQVKGARMKSRMPGQGFKVKIEFNMYPDAVAEANAFLKPEGEME